MPLLGPVHSGCPAPCIAVCCLGRFFFAFSGAKMNLNKKITLVTFFSIRKSVFEFIFRIKT
jgi:hypothetical protein